MAIQLTEATCPEGCDGDKCHCQGCGEFVPNDVVNGYCARCCDHESWLRGGGPNGGRHGLYCEFCGQYKDDLMEDLAQRLDDLEEEDPETGRIGYRLPSWITGTELQRYMNPLEEEEY